MQLWEKSTGLSDQGLAPTCSQWNILKNFCLFVFLSFCLLFVCLFILLFFFVFLSFYLIISFFFVFHFFCQIKVPYLLVSTMKCPQRLLAKCALKGRTKKEKEKRWLHCLVKTKNMLTMPRALSASSPTSAPDNKTEIDPKIMQKVQMQTWIKVKTSKSFENLCKHNMQCIASSVLTFPYVCSHS